MATEFFDDRALETEELLNQLLSLSLMQGVVESATERLKNLALTGLLTNFEIIYDRLMQTTQQPDIDNVVKARCYLLLAWFYCGRTLANDVSEAT